MKNLTTGTWQYIIYAIHDSSYSILFIIDTVETACSSVDNNTLSKSNTSYSNKQTDKIDNDQYICFLTRM